MKLKIYALMLFSLVAFTACGSDSDDSSSADTLNKMPSNATYATASTANAEDMVNSDKISKSAKSASSVQSDEEKLVKLKIVRNSVLSNVNDTYPSRVGTGSSSKATISDTYSDNCKDGGSITGGYSYDTDTFIMDFTLNANNCISGNSRTNGSIVMKVQYNSNSLDSYKELEFKIGSSGYRITSTINSYNVYLAANSYYKEYDITSYDVSADEPVVYKDAFYFMARANDEVFYEDSVVQHLSTTKYYYLSGTLYISDNEYFTVDTSYDANATPFEIDSNYNIIDGTAQFVGENNGTIQIDITTSNTATIRIDADNDDVWESEQTGIDISNFGW